MTPPPPAAPQTNPFRYGWRFVRAPQADGGEELTQVPLTLEDVLHPREGDVIPQTSLHEMECTYLAGVFRSRPIRPPFARVTNDLLIDWGVEDVRDHSPDVAVFAGLREEPDLTEGTFHLADSGGRCLLVVENVSPSTRVNDVVAKFAEYRLVGVPLYVVIDQEREGGPRSLLGYRLTPDGYVAAPLNAEGRLPLRPLGLHLGLRDGRVTCHDAATGAELGDYAQLARALEAMEQQRQENEKAMEEAVLRAHKAERGIVGEQKARAEAERVATEQAKARKKAERVAKEQVKAREKAERVASEETKARMRAEDRIRELEEALGRRQGTGDS